MSSPHCVDNDYFNRWATEEARRQFRASLNIPPATKVILYVGRLIPAKRPVDVVTAAHIIRSRGINVRVVFAGAGELLKTIERAAQELEVPVHLLGFCNQTQLPNVYAASDVVVLPSETETWGLVVNEALASGVPCVASELCGCAELLADGSAGRLFPPKNTKALAQALFEMIERPPSQTAIASKIRAYSIKMAAEGVEAAMHSLSRA